MSVTKTIRDISELKAVAQTACNLFMDECKKAGLDIFITETYRSQARQNYLYEQGRTRPGPKVTWTRNSRHTSRLAWDIAVNPPKDLYDIDTLKKAGAIARKFGIVWGGDWLDNIDRPHFEVKANWKPPTKISVEKPKKEEEKKVSETIKLSESLSGEMGTVLKRFSEKETNPHNKDWRDKFLKGELSKDEAIGLLYSAVYRGFIGNADLVVQLKTEVESLKKEIKELKEAKNND